MTFKTVNRLFLEPRTFMGFIVWRHTTRKFQSHWWKPLGALFCAEPTPVSMFLAEMRCQGAKASKETVTRYMRKEVT